MRWKFLPVVVKSRLRIDRVLVGCAHGLIPLPTSQLASRWMVGENNACGSCGRALGLLKHRELIGIHRVIFVYAGFDVPSRKIASEGSGKRACPESAHRRTLPETVIDVTRVQRRFFCAGIFQRLPDGTLPSCFGDVFAAPCRKCQGAEDEQKGRSSTHVRVH